MKALYQLNVQNVSNGLIRFSAHESTEGVTLHTATLTYGSWLLPGLENESHCYSSANRKDKDWLEYRSHTAYICINNNDHDSSLDNRSHSSINNKDHDSSLDNRSHTAYRSAADQKDYDCSLDYRRSHIVHSSTAGWTYGKGLVDSIRSSV